MIKRLLQQQVSITKGISLCQSIAEFILKHGKSYRYKPLPSPMTLEMPKYCFHNSYHYAIKRGLIYVEGYATSRDISGIPILHAWNVRPDSNIVVDVTSDAFTHYYGVPFTTEYLKEHHQKYPNNASLLDNWHNNWPVLRMDDKVVRNLIVRSGVSTTAK